MLQQLAPGFDPLLLQLHLSAVPCTLVLVPSTILVCPVVSDSVLCPNSDLSKSNSHLAIEHGCFLCRSVTPTVLSSLQASSGLALEGFSVHHAQEI